MSAFYDQASLVMVPSGYKNGKIYSQKPLSTSGELSFSRASNATRVNSSGLVEKVRTNLLTYSEQFDNAAWVKTSTGLALAPVVTANAGIAPDGTTTADRVVFNATAGGSVLLQNVSGAVGYTLSIYVKSNTGSNQSIQLRIDSAPNAIITATTEWQRFTVTASSWSAATRDVGLDLRTAVGTSADLLVWGAQWEASDVVTDYIATTSAAVSVGPVSGLPRLDYSGGASCCSLLLEGQRTNLVTYSEQMTLWANGAASVTANATTSPDGYQNADSINNTTDVSTFVAASNGVYTWSLFVKQGTSASASIDMSDGATGDVLTTFTFATKTFSGTSAGGSWASPSTAYQDYGNGWYRISLTATKGAGSTIGHKINASGTGTTFVWGAQLEAGAYATSYIPTLSSAVTRVQDATSKTGIGSLIGVNQGSIYVELDANGIILGGANYIFDLSDGTNFDQNRIAMYWTSANDLNIFYGYGGTFASGVYTSNYLTTKKVAVRWTSTQLQVVINGVAQTALTYGNSSPTKLSVGIRYNDVEPLASNVKQCLLFNNTLTTAQLQELTTL